MAPLAMGAIVTARGGPHVDLESFDRTLRDLYAAPGTRIKQWVVELRREQAWAAKTCPRIDVPEHIDNCMPLGWDVGFDSEYGPPIGGRAVCRNVGSTQWTHLDHDSCHTCGDLHEATRSRPDVAAWIALRALRPPITSDREALSDEVAPALELRGHPAIVALTGRSWGGGSTKNWGGK